MYRYLKRRLFHKPIFLNKLWSLFFSQHLS